MDASAITALLRKKHSGEVFVEELRGGAGYGGCSEGYIDAWTMHPYPSKQNCRIAYEVKISRSDFLRDIKQPLKHRAALLFSNEFYFVAPEGMLGAEDLPLFAGLIEVKEYENGTVEGRMGLDVSVNAPWRDTSPPSWRFVVSLVRNIERREKTRRSVDK